MPNGFKMSKESLIQLLQDHGNNLRDSDKLDLAQILINKSEGSRYFLCPTSVTTGVKVDVSTILYLSQPLKKGASIHLFTGEELSYGWSDIDLFSYIETNFENFKCVDLINGILVNLDMVKWYDSDMNRVYFSEEHFIQVTGAAIRKVLVEYKGKEYDLYLKKGLDKKASYIPMGLSRTKKLI